MKSFNQHIVFHLKKKKLYSVFNLPIIIFFLTKSLTIHSFSTFSILIIRGNSRSFTVSGK